MNQLTDFRSLVGLIGRPGDKKRQAAETPVTREKKAPDESVKEFYKLLEAFRRSGHVADSKARLSRK
jgi:hypothetical protein